MHCADTSDFLLFSSPTRLWQSGAGSRSTLGTKSIRKITVCRINDNGWPRTLKMVIRCTYPAQLTLVHTKTWYPFAPIKAWNRSVWYQRAEGKESSQNPMPGRPVRCFGVWSIFGIIPHCGIQHRIGFQDPIHWNLVEAQSTQINRNQVPYLIMDVVGEQ